MATTNTTGATSGRNVAAELAYLTRVLKAPSLHASIERLGERARAESWTHEEFLAACLQREVAARESHGGEARIRSARFPARKALEEFDFDHQRSLKREVIAHLGTLDFVAAKENVVFLGPPGTGKTHLSIGLGIRACQAGHRVAFATAAQWVARLADAHTAGRLQDELVKLARIPVLIVDEVGYIPFEPEAANLFFQLVSSRYVWRKQDLIERGQEPVLAEDCIRAGRSCTGRRQHPPASRGQATQLSIRAGQGDGPVADPRSPGDLAERASGLHQIQDLATEHRKVAPERQCRPPRRAMARKLPGLTYKASMVQSQIFRFRADLLGAVMLC